ncbi:hypothetical protein ANRL2_02835 [Anaerolineae bacterium]|nr:hypothetical protein ANRL2_02835 [Anaerolineae bacterium]
MPEFDWYQATVRSGVDDVLECLAGLAPGVAVSHSKGMHGYATTTLLGSDRDGTVARVMHGGSHEYPHAVVSGEWAQPGAELIRAVFPDHSVSRCDVREDFTEEGAFDAIQPHLLSAAASHRVKVGTAGDHLLTMKGRTVYLGAPSSPVRLRLYDKREEMLAKLPVGPERARAFVEMAAAWGHAFPDHWARLEAQIRPHTKESRTQFASIEPVDALGCSAWMREVWRQVAGLALEPVKVGRGWRPSDDARAYRYMLAHYGGVLRRLQRDLGSWECVGLQLGEDLKGEGRR